MESDGNYLPRAISLHLYGTQENFAAVRREVRDELEKRRHLYEPYFAGQDDVNTFDDLDDY